MLKSRTRRTWTALAATEVALAAAVVLLDLLLPALVLLALIDGLAFCVLRYRFATLWASILAHGFNNTIGFVAFYLVGPVYGLG